MIKESIKKRLYEILEAGKEDDPVSKAYDYLILVAILVGLLPLTVKWTNTYVRTIDLITAIIFLFDYLARLFTADYKMGIKSYKAYLYYFISPMAIIDLLSILPIISFFVPVRALGLFRMFRILRLSRIFRVLKLIRYSKSFVIMAHVIKNVKNQLLAVLFLSFFYIITVALVMFNIEPIMFDNFFESFYWAAISVMAIGYGDIVPATNIGRAITVISSMVGIAIIALPTGIITASYTEEIKKQKNK